MPGNRRSNRPAYKKSPHFLQTNPDYLLQYKILEKEIIIKENICETPIQRGLKDLVNSIKINKKTSSSGNDGLKSLEAIVASIKSFNNKKEIKLPLPSNHFKIDSK